ncbi:His/Gly/Thr/Pro-type tRNA ligase C-terminal domain-containing protein [Empedobacter sp. UBA7248]
MLKFADWETKGVPLRISIVDRDMQSNSVEVVCRDT